jgi:hypothetical protein
MTINMMGAYGASSRPDTAGSSRGQGSRAARPPEGQASDQVSLSPVARALSQATARGDEVLELKLSPSQLRALVDAGAIRKGRPTPGGRASAAMSYAAAVGDHATATAAAEDRETLHTSVSRPTGESASSAAGHALKSRAWSGDSSTTNEKPNVG